jgi:hypothetical protein
MDLQEKLKVARTNVGNLQTEANRINTLLVKWQGVAEFLDSVIKEEAEAKKQEEAKKQPDKK